MRWYGASAAGAPYQQHDVLHVRGVREHVDGLHLGYPVVGVQEGEVARLCGGVAAYVNDSLRARLEYYLYHIRMHACPWRVGDDDVGASVALYEGGGEDVLHVAGEELGVVYAVESGVYLGVLYGLRNVFYAHDLARRARHEVGNGARSRVEVVDERLGCRRICGRGAGLTAAERKLPRHRIEVVCLLGVGLVEALRPDLEFQALHGLIDEVCALVGRELQVADGVVALLVVDVDEAGDLRECRRYMFQEVHGLLLVSRLVVMELHEKHPLAGVGVAEHKVAEQAVLGADIVERQAFLHGIAVNLIAHLVVEVVHQPAFLYGVYLVERPRDVEADGTLRQSLAFRHPLQFLGGVPASVGTAELQFVAVFPLLDGAQDGTELRQRHLADARQLVEDLRLLGLQLLGVGKRLPLAAAADAEVAAPRLYP